ncbi:MAG: hypothetical protein ACRDRK_12475 [Pseudonocardia sp.]
MSSGDVSGSRPAGRDPDATGYRATVNGGRLRRVLRSKADEVRWRRVRVFAVEVHGQRVEHDVPTAP